MNDWRQIEDWVKNCMLARRLEAGLSDTLVEVETLGPKFCELGRSVIYEAGASGETGKCDCLIHSILACLSSSFRKLRNDSERNLIASFFRRKLLVNWQKIGYLKNVERDDLTAKHCMFLGDKLGEEICRLLKINVLWLQNPEDRSPSAMFKDNNSEYTISIHGDSSHFRPIFLKNNNDGQNDYILTNFIGQVYEMECFYAAEESKVNCDFQIGDIVIYKDEDWQVMGRRFGNTVGREQKCVTIVLERISDKKQETVNIDDVKIEKKRGGRKTRSKKRTARKTRRSKRY